MTSKNRSQGYTLIESLVTLAVVSLAMVFAGPTIQNMIRSAKLEGVAREASQLVQRARLESVRRSTQTVVRLDRAGREVIAFADLHGESADDPPDGIFNPLVGLAPGRTDYLLASTTMPSGVSPAAPAGQDVIEGLTTIPDADPVMLLLPDGSAEAVGAYRFGDARENYLEIRVEPRATARVTVAKWDERSNAWWSRGEGERSWRWN